MARHFGPHAMVGAGGNVRVPRSESAEIDRALESLSDGNVRRAKEILIRLRSQVEEGYHRNPSSSRMYEPFRIVGVIGKDVHSVAYKHAKDGKPYKHDFERNSAEVLAVERHGKRELLITSPEGVPLWDEF